MADKAFQIWRGDNAVLIQFATGGHVELSSDDAARLAAELAPQPIKRAKRSAWSDQEKEELRRLYQDERWTLEALGARFGLKSNATVNGVLRHLGIPANNPKMAAAARQAALTRHARKRAA